MWLFFCGWINRLAGGCIMSSSAPKQFSGNSVTLKINEKATFEGLTVKLLGIAEDSRCPRNVNCFWSGEIVTQISLSSQDMEQTVYLGDLGVPIMNNSKYGMDKNFFTKTAFVFNGHQIRISKAEPIRETTQKIKPSDYRITFAVDIYP